MLKEVGASGQISLGKKYAGKLFDLQTQEDGSIVMRPVKVVPMAQEERADYQTTPVTPITPATPDPAQGDGWLTPERLARRAAVAARTPAEIDAARSQWEEENKEAIEAMNTRMAKIGSMGMRVHAWRKAKSQPQTATLEPATDDSHR